MIRSFGALFACALLAACNQQGAALQSPPRGSAVDTLTASSVMKNACTDTAPSFRGFTEYVENGAFQREPSGIYRHASLDLSLNLTSDRKTCSMVFRSNEDPGLLAISMTTFASAATGGDKTIGLDPSANAGSTDIGGGAVFYIRRSQTLGPRYFVAAVEVP